MPELVTWAEFRRARPDLADAGRGLLYQFGVGLAFLATVRADGGPRLHPMCPILTERGLFAFIVPSPKRDDLLRDGRYALHAFPADESEDAFYVTGLAEARTEPAPVRALAAQFMQERGMSAPPPDFDDHMLFELLIERSMLTRTTGHGDPAPVHTVWRPGAPVDLG